VLFPLGGTTPMIAYVLEFLEASGVEEAFVFCSSFAGEVERFLASSKYSSGIGDMVVRAVRHEKCATAGDALREVHTRELLKSEPFVLISGDVVSNINLAAVIEEHKLRHARDKECIMTMCFKQAPSTCRTRALGDDLVVAMDGKDSRILQYLDEPGEAEVRFDSPCFKHHTKVRFRYDLLDCNVDVCSLSMVDRIADEYDVQDLRRHFVTREVADRELGLKVFGHVVQGEYAARVFDPRTYDTIACDVIRRWAHPLTVDNNFLDFSASSFTCSRGNRYKETGVQLAPTAEIGPNTVLAGSAQERTHVGDRARVLGGSTVGRGCRIADGALVSGSHLWRGVTVEAGAVVDRSILCDGVVVRRGAHIGRGCILSFGVVVDAGVTIPDFTRLTCVPRELVRQRRSAEEGMDAYSDDEDEDDSDGGGGGTKDFDWPSELADMTPENDPKVVGPDGIGRVWDPSEDNDDNDSDDDSDSDEERGREKITAAMRARRALIARSMGATEHEEHVALRWEAWVEDMGQGGGGDGERRGLGVSMGGADGRMVMGGNGGRGDAEGAEFFRGSSNGGGGLTLDAVQGDGLGGEDGASSPTADGGGGNGGGGGGGGGGGAASEEELGNFRAQIAEWVSAFRQDDSIDMNLQIRMYALQVDVNLRPEAARLIVADVLENDCATPSAADVKGQIKALLGKWKNVLKSFAQDYSEAGVAILAAVEDFVVKQMEEDAECSENPEATTLPIMAAFPFIVMALYSDLELITYEAIQKWRTFMEEEEGKLQTALFNMPLLQRVLAGIQAQEDESSGSDSGSDSGSGSSDSD
jgi:translation initiation factor eIF-2B subunit epsilon